MKTGYVYFPAQDGGFLVVAPNGDIVGEPATQVEAQRIADEYNVVWDARP